YGHFYGGDCYLVLYTYMKGHKPAYIIYFWQVAEPPVRLFQVRGTDEMNTKATEVPTRASSLNSNDVFVLKTEQTTYLWCGKGCSGDEREMAKSVSNNLSKREKQTILEGKEPAEFWLSLGGKAPYANDKRFQEEDCAVEPRLFECSNQTGRFIMSEVNDFTQEDLDEEDIMLLDTWTEVLVGLHTPRIRLRDNPPLVLLPIIFHLCPLLHQPIARRGHSVPGHSRLMAAQPGPGSSIGRTWKGRPVTGVRESSPSAPVNLTAKALTNGEGGPRSTSIGKAWPDSDPSPHPPAHPPKPWVSPTCA
uniref:Gelsolin-like domain-containing protein n=1 Tax=Callorhinchus milii TaxID=7868 RepID=A0A4W3H2F4_CALMI